MEKVDKRSNDLNRVMMGLGTHCSTPTVATDFNWIQIISMFHVPESLHQIFKILNDDSCNVRLAPTQSASTKYAIIFARLRLSHQMHQII